MDYELAQKSIITRLEPFRTVGIDLPQTKQDIVLQALPQDQNDFKRPFEKGKITVAYKGSKWGKPTSTGHISQDEEVMWEITMQSRTLYKGIGVYRLMQMVVQALVGFSPENCDKMYAHEAGLTGSPEQLVDQVWTYTVVMCCRNLSVEDFEEDLTVLFKKFTNKDTTLGEEFEVTEKTNKFEL